MLACLQCDVAILFSAEQLNPTSLSEYGLQLSPDHQRIEAVKNPRRIETHFRSPQLHLWQTSDTQWLLALRRPEPAARRNRDKIVALARQLPLPEVGATR